MEWGKKLISLRPPANSWELDEVTQYLPTFMFDALKGFGILSKKKFINMPGQQPKLVEWVQMFLITLCS